MSIINMKHQSARLVASAPFRVGDILSVEIYDNYGYEYKPCVVTDIRAVLYAYDNDLTIEAVISWYSETHQDYRSALLQNESVMNAKIVWSSLNEIRKEVSQLLRTSEF